MAQCINCGDYTKFNGGLCYKCYKKENNSNVVEEDLPFPVKKTSNYKKRKNKNVIAAEDLPFQGDDSISYKRNNTIVEKQKVKKNDTANTWVYNLIKGRIAETIIEELFLSLGFQVFKYGMENTIPGIMELLKGVKDDVAMEIKRMPDLVVYKDGRAHFIEVKFRANGCFKLIDIDRKGDYPYQNALIVLVSKKHIKCISFQELQEGKEITESSRNYLGNRIEFDTDKDKIIEYCKYAVKFFENV
ncbi:hypothetical protein HNV10_05625 [Winogradskyella litoriviva]|uniref:PD-(D/E)XK nuclease superfamily protein n=1 Tax=Winogradskyella litoriviva TaxID=1220182 RepID=A0ABX2E2J4_9FLAO|nr:hypothetical protein [Winogradskyella litoriviva]NRD22709.1 hypothetical protein [Winogradskyella litoriviva]